MRGQALKGGAEQGKYSGLCHWSEQTGCQLGVTVYEKRRRRVHLARIDGARWYVDAEEPASIE